MGTSTQVIQKSINELTAEEVDAVLLPEVSLRVFLPHVWTATGAGMDEDCRIAPNILQECQHTFISALAPLTAQLVVSPSRVDACMQGLYSDISLRSKLRA